MHQVGRGLQDVVGALGYAKLAGSAAVIEILDALGTEGGEGFGAVVADLGQDFCETSVVFPGVQILGLQCGSADCQSRRCQECAAAGIRLSVTGSCGLFSLFALVPGKLIMQRVELAVVDAVEAGDAAAVVHLVEAMLMQEALQRFSQVLQSLHFSVSITGRNIAQREKKLSSVPTGQMVLHQVRPFLQARKAITTSVTAAMMTVGIIGCFMLVTMRPKAL